MTASARATTFYVSPRGSDHYSGRSPDRPWRTVTHVDDAALKPGDVVLFQGGAAFRDNTLMPGAGRWVSGRTGAPVVFGSYGRGQARLPEGIWIKGERHLVFEDLNVGPRYGLEGLGYGITVQRCSFRDFLGAVGVPLQPHGVGWTILDNRIERTADSGMVLRGSRYWVQGNTVLRTGMNRALNFGTHGIYLKASRSEVLDNLIVDFHNDGISVRYGDSIIQGNFIAGGEFGIAWFQYASWRGTSKWTGNLIRATTIAGIYISPFDEGGATNENFVIVANRIIRPKSEPRGWGAIALSRNHGWYRVTGNQVVS